MLFGLFTTAKEIEKQYKNNVDESIQDDGYKKGTKK